MNWARKCVKSSSLLPRRLARRAAAAAVDDAYDPQFSSPEDVARCLKLDDFQTFAERRLPRPLCVQISEKETPREGTPENACLARALRYEYLASGTGDEQTLRENRDAWGRIFLRPRVLRDVARVETRTELFGQPLSMPVFTPVVAEDTPFDRSPLVSGIRGVVAACQSGVVGRGINSRV